MQIDLNSLIAGLSALSAALAIFINWKKINETGQNDRVWKALTDKTLKDISDDLKDIKNDVSRNDGRLQKQSEEIKALDVRVTEHDHQLERTWERIDELKGRAVK